MKTCPDCGERVYSLGCVNCNESAYIAQQVQLDASYGLEDKAPPGVSSPTGAAALKDMRCGQKDRRKKRVAPCYCGHFERLHRRIYDGESMKFFWFCSGCGLDGKKYPETHHKSAALPPAPQEPRT